MKRKIHLQGELKDLYVDSIIADVSSVHEAIKLLEANFPSIRKYFLDCHEKGVGFEIIDGSKILEQETDLIVDLNSTDLYLTPVISGSSGVGKVFTAILLVALAFTPLGQVALLGTTLGTILVGTAINLALTGIAELLAPDPSVDKSAPQAYLFSGSEQNIVEGDPVPVLYGQLEIPGRPISFSVINSAAKNSNSQSFSNSTIKQDGSISILGDIN